MKLMHINIIILHVCLLWLYFSVIQGPTGTKGEPGDKVNKHSELLVLFMLFFWYLSLLAYLLPRLFYHDDFA